MLTWIFTHLWKETTRSAGWQQSLVVKIITGVLMLFFALNLSVLGYFLDVILKEIVPDQNIVLTFNQGILYYLGLDLAVRFMLQQAPVLAMQPYLHLPIRKSKLIHFLLSRSLFSFGNLLPFFLAGPFAFKVILPAYGLLSTLAWGIGLLSLVLFSHFLSIYLKRQLALQPKVTLLLIAGLLGLVLLEYQQIFSVSTLTQNGFAALLTQPAFGFLLLLLPVAMYALNYALLRRNMYSTEPEKATAKVTNVQEFAFLKKFGAAGNLLALEMKLIWRNKRPRSIFLMSFLMVAYGGLIVLMRETQEENVPNTIMMIFAGILTTGASMMYYGQYLHSWDANYFDSLMSRNISIYEYYRSKFLLFVGMCTLAFLLSLVYVFLDREFFFMIAAVYLYNIGVNSFLIFLLGVYGAKKINLSKSAAFNWEGAGATQMLMSLPFIFGPALVCLPFYFLEKPALGMLALATLGVTGLLFHKPILKKMAQRLQKRKYKMAVAFRAA